MHSTTNPGQDRSLGTNRRSGAAQCLCTPASPNIRRQREAVACFFLVPKAPISPAAAAGFGLHLPLSEAKTPAHAMGQPDIAFGRSGTASGVSLFACVPPAESSSHRSRTRSFISPAMRISITNATKVNLSGERRCCVGAGRGGRTPTRLPSADFEFPDIPVSLR